MHFDTHMKLTSRFGLASRARGTGMRRNYIGHEDFVSGACSGRALVQCEDGSSPVYKSPSTAGTAALCSYQWRKRERCGVGRETRSEHSRAPASHSPHRRRRAHERERWVRHKEISLVANNLASGIVYSCSLCSRESSAPGKKDGRGVPDGPLHYHRYVWSRGK